MFLDELAVAAMDWETESESESGSELLSESEQE